MKWIRFAVLNVFRNRRRAAITIAITAVGVTAILVGGGFALFTFEGLRESAARDTGHVVMAHGDFFTLEEKTPGELGMSDFQTVIEKIEDQEPVKAVLPRLQFTGLISNGEKSTIFIGEGVDPRKEFQVKGPFLRILDGKALPHRPKKGEMGSVMLGYRLAQSLGAKPGSILTLLSTTGTGALNAVDVMVRGVFTVDVPDIDKRLIYVNLKTAQELVVTTKVSTLSVFLFETGDTLNFAQQLKKDFPEKAYRTWEDLAFYYKGVKGIYSRIFGVLGVVIVLMVFFAVSNTISMSVAERTREIGTLRAMGTTTGQVVKNFILEAGIVSFAGSLLGLILTGGVITALVFADLQMPPPPGRSAGYPLSINFSADLSVVTATAVLIASLFSAWLASRGAAKKPIVEALTHV